ncbi:MAG: DUF502 domain-containing protein [Candidatus Riflebacteria bacterium]|nr:DUF502 domain-containing protein [Candidatus Riflebacteria bacterium]
MSESLVQRLYRGGRSFFFTGMLVVIPPGITLYLLYVIWGWLDGLVASLLPPSLFDDVAVRIAGSLVGIVVPVLTITLAGAAAQTYIGAGLQRFYENLITRVPVLGRVFTWLRQISEMIFTDKRQVFNKVALIEYPRKGLWTLAFVSSPASREIVAKSGGELTSIFVPTTPNPTSGFLLMVPSSELVLMDMGPEDALKIILSGGIISPDTAARPESAPGAPGAGSPPPAP